MVERQATRLSLRSLAKMFFVFEPAVPLLACSRFRSAARFSLATTAGMFHSRSLRYCMPSSLGSFGSSSLSFDWTWFFCFASRRPAIVAFSSAACASMSRLCSLTSLLYSLYQLHGFFGCGGIWSAYLSTSRWMSLIQSSASSPIIWGEFCSIKCYSMY